MAPSLRRALPTCLGADCYTFWVWASTWCSSSSPGFFGWVLSSQGPQKTSLIQTADSAEPLSDDRHSSLCRYRSRHCLARRLWNRWHYYYARAGTHHCICHVWHRGTDRRSARRVVGRRYGCFWRVSLHMPLLCHTTAADQQRRMGLPVFPLGRPGSPHHPHRLVRYST